MKNTKRYHIWCERKDGTHNGKWDISGFGTKESRERLAKEFDAMFPDLRHVVRKR